MTDKAKRKNDVWGNLPKRVVSIVEEIITNFRRARAKREFVNAALKNEDLFREVLRLPSYFLDCDRNRFWLEEVLSAKQEILSFLNQRKTDERMQSFARQLSEFRAASIALSVDLPVLEGDLLPILSDALSYTPFDRHYIYHPAWAARIIAKTQPDFHTDISSILAFSTILSAFVPTIFYDFRPADLYLTGLTTKAADLTSLPFESGSLKSLSCMHVIEHIGLGRYGDPIDPVADQKAISELVRVLAPGGDLLIATPVGRERVQFNAHRVYDPIRFVERFAPLELVEFTLIEETGAHGPIQNADMLKARDQSYACGCFWFRKGPL
jgi:SAM-dependent methyltransferase